MEKYCIVTNGDIALGFNKDEVNKNIVQLCKYDSETLKELFSGFPFTFKTGMDEVTAERYKQALDRTGIVCRVEVVIPEKKIEIDTHDSFAISHHPRSEQVQQMVCPKCGAKQAKRLTCDSCGVVIEKYVRQKHAVPQFEARKQPDHDSVGKSNSSRSKFFWFVMLVLFGVVAYFAFSYYSS